MVKSNYGSALRRISILLVVVASAGAAAQVALPEWQIEMVDRSATGKFTSLKIDRDGNVHVAYVTDNDANMLTYAFWDHLLKKWFTMPVAGQSGPCALTLDSKQRPHISYNDFGTGSGAKLRHAYWDGTQWIKQVIPVPSDIVAYYNSIVMDAADHPAFSFYEYVGRKDTNTRIRMRSVIWDDEVNGWAVRTVDGEEGSGKFNAMTVDDHFNIHLAYANVGAGGAGARYAFWNGAKWTTTEVDGFKQNGGESVGFNINIAVDRQGDPRLTYINESTPTLKYAERKNGTWRVTAIETLGGFAYPDRNSIALDDAGQPYIGYYDAGRGLLKLAHREGDTWKIEVVDGNLAGFTSSMQIHNGEIWMSYSDERSHAMKVAHRRLDDAALPSAAASPAAKARP